MGRSPLSLNLVRIIRWRWRGKDVRIKGGKISSTKQYQQILDIVKQYEKTLSINERE